MQAAISIFNDLFSGVSTNALTAFLDKPWTADAMFYVTIAFFLTMIILFVQSFDRNEKALHTQRHPWMTRVVTAWLMPLFAFVAATAILTTSVEFYEQTSAGYLRSADQSLVDSSMILLLTAMIFKKVSVYDGLRDGLAGLFSFRRRAER